MQDLDTCLPALPLTGSAGGNAALILIALGIVAAAFSVFFSRDRRTGLTLGLLLIMGSAAATLNFGTLTASADEGPRPCITPGSTATPFDGVVTTQTTVAAQSGAPGDTQTAAPAAPPATPTAAPTATPTGGIPTVQPTVPSKPSGKIAGKFRRTGNDVKITTMPADIPPGTKPKPIPGVFEDQRLTSPDGWLLPQITPASPAGQIVNLRSPGSDGIPGTADDFTVATTTTDDTGAYVFTDVPPGSYRVAAVLPDLPKPPLCWKWSIAWACLTSNDPAVDPADAGNRFTSPATHDVVLGNGDVDLDNDFETTNHLVLDIDWDEK